MGRDWLITNRRWLAPLGIVAALALALAWWQPWQADPPTTPRPIALVPTRTPTATPVVVRVPLPTVRPQPSEAPPTPAPATPVAAAPSPRAATPNASIAASGTLLYLGFANGRGGIVASNADGSGQRLLVPGIFGTLAVASDGARLAAIGPIPDGGDAYQLAIFAADGRAVARHPFGRGTRGPLIWSPSGRYLLGSVFGTDNGQPPRWQTWVFGDDGAWPVEPPDPAITFPYGWTPDDRIAFLAGEDPSRPLAHTLWTTDTTGDDAQVVYAGPLVPINWNRDGTLLYAFAYNHPDGPNAALTRLVALELPSGNVRDLAAADALAVGALGVPNIPGTYRFDFAIPSPDGRMFAIGLARLSGPGTPTPRTGMRATSIIFMRADGLITGTAPLPPGDVRRPSAWSPDGSRFALLVPGANADDGQILALDTTGHQLATYPVQRAFAGYIPQFAWSRDGQWLAYTSYTGLVVANIDTPGTILVAPGGIQAAWRP